ncbi:DUF5682 family protein [Nocardia bovistercoris]|uniref:Uncharacterized protein n=1 Tax=Nocardia bovistercoris TaxID=2785916 RepID=A0A931N296_9NOCA|nr:DUF5682 family protein [Nocardia bovistercoris]MBH0775806.1 hypothetical protein [Nocardia bovistercoris]
MNTADGESAPVTRIFGIRHHGPGSARSLRTALESFAPDAILIEGPADADPLVEFVGDPDLRPPIALLAYVPATPARAAFWPFAAFSPEWQALRYAAEHDVPVRFCDLPAANALAATDEGGERGDPLADLAAAGGYDDAERWWDAVIESRVHPANSPTAEVATAAPFDTATPPAVAPTSTAAATTTATGIPATTTATGETATTVADRAVTGDAARATTTSATATAIPQPTGGTKTAAAGTTESATGALSSAPGGEAVAAFEAITEAMAALREPADSEAAPTVDAHTLRREAYMRQTMRAALKAGARRLAVVCGAWHAPALAGPLGPAAPDQRLLKGMPKVKATVTWVPWTHSRLASTSGYGAGITSPGWYHHLFTEVDRPVARWLTKVAGVLRAHDLPVSSAHVIEAVRLAETLAALRNRPLAGLSEVTEAVRAVLCGGDEAMVRVVVAELVVGEALGAVPEGVPTVPLDADLRARIRTLRMKQEPRAKSIDLDLRKERELERSRLLHRLRLLGIDWGVPATGEVRATGTFRESWTLRWRPEFAVAVIEASRWGSTLRTAAAAKILDTAHRDGVTLTELTAALDAALLADLGDATDGLVARLESVAALDHDVTHLLAALPGLVDTLRYGDVRGTDTKALGKLADGLLIRICAGLPGAVTGLDTDAATALRDLLDAAHTAINTRDDATASGAWLAALGRLADRGDVHGALVGRAVRLLADGGILDDDDDAARRLAAALSVGNTPAAKAAWIDGFLGGRGLLLVHDRELLRLIDSWLASLGEQDFVETLPLLRRTFGAFESGERRAIGRAVRDTGSTPARARTIDNDRGLLALRAVADILGVRT